MDDRVPAGRLPPLADDEAADLGPSRHPGDRFSGYHLLCRPQARQGEGGGYRGRHRPRAEEDLRQTRHTARRAARAERDGGRCRDGFGVGQDHFQGDAGRKGDCLLLDERSHPRLSGADSEVSRQRGALYGQLLRRAQCGGLLRRFVLLRPEGGSLPDGAEYLFPHQCRRYGAVRADAHRGRRGGVRQLSGGVYRAAAR